MILILGKQPNLQYKININVRRKNFLMPQDIRNVPYLTNYAVGTLTMYKLHQKAEDLGASR